MDSPLMRAVGAWLLTYLLHSSLLLGASWFLLRAAPTRWARFAETAWRVALFGSVLTASAHLLLAWWHPDLLAFASVATGMSSNASTGQSAWLASPRMTQLIAALSPLAAPLVISWGTVAMLRLLALARAHWSFRRSLGNRIPLADQGIVDRVRTLSGSVRVRVSVSSGISTPMVIGANEVCMPSRAVDSLTPPELDAALAHEVAHVLRRDRVWLSCASVFERALFLQPLNRLAHARLRALAECACDDWAVRRTRDPVALASALTRVTGWLSASSSPSLAFATAARESLRESFAVARIRRILDPATQHSLPATVAERCALTMGMLLTVLLFAPGASGRDSEGRQRGSAVGTDIRYTITAHDNAGPFTLTLEGRRVVGMTMDGVPVTRERLRRIGNRLLVHDPTRGSTLDLTLTGEGGIRWTSRSSLASLAP